MCIASRNFGLAVQGLLNAPISRVGTPLPLIAASLQGKPAMLWFWVPWCPFSNGQASGVSQVAAANPKVTFEGIAGRSDVGVMRGFVSRYNLNVTNRVAALGT